MIYHVKSPKFRSYLRDLTKEEKVRAVYQAEMDKQLKQKEKDEAREQKEFYDDWEKQLPGLYMEMNDHPWWLKRKIEESRKG